MLHTFPLFWSNVFFCCSYEKSSKKRRTEERNAGPKANVLCLFLFFCFVFCFVVLFLCFIIFYHLLHSLLRRLTSPDSLILLSFPKRKQQGCLPHPSSSAVILFSLPRCEEDLQSDCSLRRKRGDREEIEKLLLNLSSTKPTLAS
jgi:Na+/H+ antiporter NhaD/arsenite permease-like protein